MSNNNFVAQINESLCIGCTLCIKACPFDAIIGANNFMHTVLVTECPGCKLCIPACPVDCIELIVTKIRKTNNEFKKQAKIAPKIRKIASKNRKTKIAPKIRKIPKITRE